MEEEICKEYLDLLDLVEYNKIFEYRTRPKLEVNITNDRLLTAFKENNWISDFQEDQNKEGYYNLMCEDSDFNVAKLEQRECSSYSLFLSKEVPNNKYKHLLRKKK